MKNKGCGFTGIMILITFAIFIALTIGIIIYAQGQIK